MRIAAGTSIGPHAVIEGPTSIGRDNRIHAHAVLGGAPQDMKYRGEPTALAIGDRNTIREFCTFNRGTTQDVGTTRIGDDNWVMAYVHIAHDVQVGNRTILANNRHAGRARACGRLGHRRRAHRRASVLQDRRARDDRLPEPCVAGRAAVHDGRRSPAGCQWFQCRGSSPARLLTRAHRAGQADASPAVPGRPDAGPGQGPHRRLGRHGRTRSSSARWRRASSPASGSTRSGATAGSTPTT